MSQICTKIVLILFSLFFSLTVVAGDDFGQQRLDGITNIEQNHVMAKLYKTKLTTPSRAIHSNYGFSISQSGNRILVGVPGSNNESGSVSVLEYNGTNWGGTQTITASNSAYGDWFGYSVSLLGNRAIVGAPYYDGISNDSGSVYVFEFDGTNWVQTEQLTASNNYAYNFGRSISLADDRILVGSKGYNNNVVDSGLAYVFDYDGTNWYQTQKIEANDGSYNDNFGVSVSMFGNRLLVGASGDDDNGTESGSAYIFDFNGTTWVQSQKITALGGAGYDYFGKSVSLYNNRVAIGAWGYYENGVWSGSAYVFDYDGVGWSQSAQLTANDGATDDNFGWSVSLFGNQVLVGASGDDDNGINSGSAYMFDYDNGSWSQIQKLTAFNGVAHDLYGHSVNLYGGRAVIGAPFHNNAGAIYISHVDLIFRSGFEQ